MSKRSGYDIDNENALITGVIDIGGLVLNTAVYANANSLVGERSPQNDLLETWRLRIVAHCEHNFVRIALELVDAFVVGQCCYIDAVDL